MQCWTQDHETEPILQSAYQGASKSERGDTVKATPIDQEAQQCSSAQLHDDLGRDTSKQEFEGAAYAIAVSKKDFEQLMDVLQSFTLAWRATLGEGLPRQASGPRCEGWG